MSSAQSASSRCGFDFSAEGGSRFESLKSGRTKARLRGERCQLGVGGTFSLFIKGEGNRGGGKE